MKFLVSAIFLLSVSNTFAYNTKYFQIYPGKNTFVDVEANKNKSVVSLLLETSSSDKNAEPKVTIERSWSGFECTHKQNLLKFSGYNTKTQIFEREYEIQIDWRAGADLSGCIVKVEFPGQKSSTVEIFMNY